LGTAKVIAVCARTIAGAPMTVAATPAAASFPKLRRDMRVSSVMSSFLPLIVAGTPAGRNRRRRPRIQAIRIAAFCKRIYEMAEKYVSYLDLAADLGNPEADSASQTLIRRRRQ
jgi:hypothetical protein